MLLWNRATTTSITSYGNAETEQVLYLRRPERIAAELTVSAKVLIDIPEENLAKLFYNREQAEFLAGLSNELLTTYPNYPYHQPAHGVDVMQ